MSQVCGNDELESVTSGYRAHHSWLAARAGVYSEPTQPSVSTKDQLPGIGRTTVPEVAPGLGSSPVQSGLVQQHDEPALQFGTATGPVGRVTHTAHSGCAQHSAAQSAAADAACTATAR